ncbi:hypothetical protein [Methanosarcina barkeri]|uniref:hypothetical protein n=1 Tax=Methanosarcina barkeri TaxID=2208 RepID=UPI00003C61F2|nr:hypothetical protein [Methanosarcina barkeri]
MIEDILYFGNVVFFLFLCEITIQVVFNVIRMCLRKDGSPTGDEYHRLYEESMEWMRQGSRKPHRR